MSSSEKRFLEFKKNGNKFFSLKKFNKAIYLYKKALEVVDSDPELEKSRYVILSNLAAAYLQLRDFENSCYYSNECVKSNPDFAKGYYRLIRSYIGIGELEIAENLLSLHEEKIPENIFAHMSSLTKSLKHPKVTNRMKLVEPILFPQLPVKRLKLYHHQPPYLPTPINFNKYPNLKDDTFYLFIYDGKIHQFGGISRGYRTNELLVLNKTRWEIVPTTAAKDDIKPPARSHHRLVMCEEDDCLYVWGGCTDFLETHDRRNQILAIENDCNVYRLDMITKIWTRMEAKGDKLPRARIMSHFGKIGDELFVLGGLNLEGKSINMLIGTCINDPLIYKMHEKYIKKEEYKLIWSYNLKTYEWEPIEYAKDVPLQVKSVFFFCNRSASLFTSNFLSRSNMKCAIVIPRMGHGLNLMYAFSLDRGHQWYVTIPCSNPYFSRPVGALRALGEGSLFQNKCRKIFDDCGMETAKYDCFDSSDSSFFPFNFCYYEEEETLLCLYRDRFLFKFDVDFFRWDVFAVLSNTGVVDELNESYKKYGHTIMFKPIDRDYFQSAPKERCKKNQFHSMIVLDGKLYCFSLANGPMHDSEKSMVVVKFESDVEMKFMRKLMKKGRRKVYTDVVISCHFF